MADKSQARRSPETEISVDLNAADPKAAVSRRETSDIATQVRDAADTDKPKARTDAEKALFKRMGNLERNLEKQFDQRLAAREAEHQRELSALKERLEKITVDRSGESQADAAHEAAIAALKEKLAAAYEKGDSQASADLTLQISKLDAQFWAKKAAAAGVTTRESTTEAAKATPAKAAPAVTRPTIAGTRFINANEAWWEDPEYSVEQGAANTIFMELRDQEGFDPKDAEMYKEVARRLKAKFPTLPVKAGAKGPEDEEEDEDEAAAHPTKARRPAPAQRLEDRGAAGAANRGNANRRTLTQEEIATMRACRLDPDNDRDVVQFLKEAVSLEAAQS